MTASVAAELADRMAGILETIRGLRADSPEAAAQLADLVAFAPSLIPAADLVRAGAVQGADLEDVACLVGFLEGLLAAVISCRPEPAPLLH